MNSKNFSKSSRFAFTNPEERASELAISALMHIVKDEELTANFLSETGFDVADLRKTLQEPGFAAIMLDYLCSHESLLLAFAAEQGIDPTEPEAARQFLTRGDSA